MSRVKRNLIITFSIIGVFVVLMIVFGVLFNVKKINVEIIESGSHVEAYAFEKEEIIKTSGVKAGENIVFRNYGIARDQLEKEYPYGKFTIVRTFPSTITIYIQERKPVFKVLNKRGEFEFYDEELKCVDIQTPSNLSSYGLDKVSTLSGADLDLCGEMGLFIDDPSFAKKLTSIIDGVYGAGETDISVMSDIIIDYDNVNKFELITLKWRAISAEKDNAGTFIIQGSSFIEDKIFYAVDIYLKEIREKAFYKSQLENVKITVLRNFNSEDKNIDYESSKKIIVSPRET